MSRMNFVSFVVVTRTGTWLSRSYPIHVAVVFAFLIPPPVAGRIDALLLPLAVWLSFWLLWPIRFINFMTRWQLVVVGRSPCWPSSLCLHGAIQRPHRYVGSAALYRLAAATVAGVLLSVSV